MSYYPRSLAAQIVWHNTFSIECNNYAGTFSTILDIGRLAKIVANKNSVAILVNAGDQAKNYAQDVLEYRDIWLEAPLGTPVPAVPVLPTAIAVAAGSVVGIEADTRQLVAQLDAHPAMTDAIRAAMGIVGTPGGLGDPSITSLEALGDSHVRLRCRLMGHSALAVNRRRNGVTERIGTTTKATFVDTDGPLVAGVSEVRVYWVQGLVNNIEQGDISAEVQIATTP